MRTKGRPKLFTNKHQVNVLLAIEDYQKLHARLAARPVAGSVGDIIRDYIRRGLRAESHEEPLSEPGSERERGARQLRAIARAALKVARDLERSA